MKKFPDYNIPTLFLKHSPDSVHGYDPVYDMSYDMARTFISELKAPSAQSAINDLKREAEKVLTAIDVIRSGTLADTELVENIARWKLADVLKEINDCIDEMEEG